MHIQWLAPDDLEWSALLGAVHHDTYHLPEYGQLDAALQQATLRAVLATDGTNRLCIPLVLRNLPDDDTVQDACSPYGYPGPLVDAAAGVRSDFVSTATKAIANALEEAGVVSMFVRLNPLLDFGADDASGQGTTVHHGDTVAIDLTLEPDEQWRQMRSNHKRNINKAKRLNHQATLDHTWQHLDTFIEIYHETMTRVGASDSYHFPNSYFTDLHDRLNGHAHLSVVSIDDEIAAGGVFFETDGIVQYHLGGTRGQFLNHQPTKLMFDTVREWAMSRGDRMFHLGGGLGGNEDSLFNFKAGFSPMRLPFHTWRLVTAPSHYERLVTAWERRAHQPSDGPEGFFPAYRKPYA